MTKLEMNKIYNMDCLDGMKMIPDNSIDLIITSPPYNLGVKHHSRSNVFVAYNNYIDDIPEEEYQEWQKKVMDECFRVLSPDGSMFYNHKNRIKKGRQITPYEWILKTDFVVKQELIWFNGSSNFDKCRFYPMTERVYWIAKKDETKLINNINHHDIFDWKAVGTNGEHKRAFPTKMCTDIMSCFPDAKTCLDPFMGSGTVAVACYDMGIDYIGFEIDKKYYEIANKRIEDAKAQIRMEL